MPTGYEGYEGYGGQRGYNRGYNYRAPQISQYESFFNPIPIDFLQQNLQQHQGQYDQSFAAGMAAKGAAMEADVSLDDQVYRNQLVDKTMQEMDKIADQYGGDYGRAAKGIARKITDLRADPFWGKTEHLKEQQAMQQKFVLENPNTYLYQDVAGIGAYNPETQSLRPSEELTFRGEVPGDYQASIIKQFDDLEAGTIAGRLTDAGVPGIHESVSIEELTATELRELANHDASIQGFYENNPDFVRIREHQGMTPEEIRAEAGELIYSQIQSKEIKNVSRRFVNAPKSALEQEMPDNPFSYKGSAVRRSFETEYTDVIKDHESKVRYINRESDPVIRAPYDAQTYWFNKRQIEKDIRKEKISEAEGRRRLQKLDLEYFDQGERTPEEIAAEKKTYHDQLIGEYNELAKYSPDEAFEKYGEYLNLMSERSDLEWNARLEDSSENIISAATSNIDDAQWILDGDVLATRDVTGRRSIVERLGYKDWATFKEAFESGKIKPIPRVDFYTGKIGMTINNNKTGEPITVRFDTDEQTRLIIEPGQTITSRFYDSQDYTGDVNERVYLRNSKGEFLYWNGLVMEFSVVGTGDIDEIVDLPETDYRRRRGSTKQVYWHTIDPATGKDIKKPVDLAFVQNMISGQVDERFNIFEGLLGNTGKK